MQTENLKDKQLKEGDEGVLLFFNQPTQSFRTKNGEELYVDKMRT